ncbi:MAG: SRPBCC domain-containing protein [Natronospirillum sp.]
MRKLIVEKSTTIKASPEKVWNIITSPETFKHWMLAVPADSSDSPLQLGSKILWNDESGQTYLTGTVVTLEPLQRLVLALEDISWTRKAETGEVTSSFTLSDAENGTDLEFMLGDLSVDPEGQQWFDAYSASGELDTIRDMAEG